MTFVGYREINECNLCYSLSVYILFILVLSVLL